MNVFKKLVVLMVFAMLAAGCWAAVATAAVEVEGGAYVGVFDKYLWRGFDLSGGEPVAQGGVDLTAGAFTLSYWSNLQLSSNDDEGYVAGEMNETDLILDYSFDINDLVSMSVGDMLYAVDGLEDTHEAYVGVYLALPLEPSLTVYWDWDEAEEAGLYYVLSVAHAFELSETLSLNLSASAGYNQESDYLVGDYSDWHNAEIGVAVDYLLSENLTLSPSYIYSTPISDDAEDISGIDDESAFGLSVAFSF
jgi:uncharacterized protein (TIGR02001 family)